MSDATIDPLYALGVPEMDGEHARCIALVEAFRVAASRQLRDDHSLDAARRSLQALFGYAQEHFASEEGLLASYGYPGLAEHKARHRELTAALLKLLRELSVPRSETLPLSLDLFVTVWLLEHIMTDDWKASHFIIAEREKI